MPKIFDHALLKAFITPAIAGTVLAILAPLGSDNFGLTKRLVFWISLTLIGGFGAMSLHFALKKYKPNAATWLSALVLSFGATIAVTPFVLFLNRQTSLSGALLTIFYIWVIAIVISAFGEMTRRKTADTLENPTRSALLERLPPKFRHADLYAITSEDHYIRIYSAAGEHMLLMRLSDAEDLAAPISGLKPHRSWWVAETGVEKVFKQDGKLRILLKSGLEVPVSREGSKRIRQANWI